MKSISLPVSRSLVITAATVLITFSCSKSNDSTNNTANYCNSIAWSSTAGQSGTFTGSTTTGAYRLTDATFTDNGTTGDFQLHYDSNGQLLNDQPGVTYTYTQDNLTIISVSELATSGSGTGEYDFDSNGHFTNGTVNFSSPGSNGPLTGIYTYDSNEDPILFKSTGTISTAAGPQTLSMTITGDYLTDKTSFLPFMPVFAPASSYFSPIPFLSKHLLNKWVISVIVAGIPTLNYTVQYTYTYDSNGKVATMVNTANSNNTYTFTYADCPK